MYRVLVLAERPCSWTCSCICNIKTAWNIRSTTPPVSIARILRVYHSKPYWHQRPYINHDRIYYMYSRANTYVYFFPTKYILFYTMMCFWNLWSSVPIIKYTNCGKPGFQHTHKPYQVTGNCASGCARFMHCPSPRLALVLNSPMKHSLTTC